MPFWYAKRLPRFTELDSHTRLDVQRVPATTTSPPCLKISQKAAISGGGSGETAVVTGSTAAGVGGQETGVGIGLPNERSTSRMEFLRLSLPVKCNRTFNKNRFLIYFYFAEIFYLVEAKRNYMPKWRIINRKETLHLVL